MQWSDLWTDDVKQAVLSLITVVVTAIAGAVGVAAKRALDAWSTHLREQAAQVADQRMRETVATVVSAVEQTGARSGLTKLGLAQAQLAKQGLFVPRAEIEAAVRLQTMAEGAISDVASYCPTDAGCAAAGDAAGAAGV